MANQTVVIPAGRPLQLSAQAKPDTLIINQDSVSSVWIAGPSVQPGIGVLLGPQGTASWNGGPLWAYNPSSLPVTLIVTDEVSATDAPVAVGLSVARQLLLTGVPNVFNLDLLYNGPITGPPVTIDVSKYASVIILCASTNNTYSLVCSKKIDLSGDAYGVEYLTNCALTTPMSWVMPVDFLSLSINNAAPATSVNIKVYGSNRPVAKFGVIPNPTGISRRFNVTGAMASGSLYGPLGNIDGGLDALTVNGRCRCRFDTTGGATGLFYFRYMQPNLVLADVGLNFNVGLNGTVETDESLPSVPIYIMFRAIAAGAAGSSATATITPG